MTTIPLPDAPPVLHAGAPIETASAAIILLHGRGGDGRNVLDLGQLLVGPEFALLAPQAPGNSWYPLSFLAPRHQNEPYLSAALQQVAAVLALAKTHGLRPASVAFCGFSQGACLATEFVARHPQRYGALVAYTGGLIGPLDEPISLTGDLAGTPVLLSSGDTDPHVPWMRVQQSSELLTKIGGQVTLQRYSGKPHSIIASEVEAGKNVLAGLV